MSREEKKRTFMERKRHIMYLIYQYLLDMGYENSANTIKIEGNLQSDYELCDNVDLDTVYMEYCSYYQLKFEKYPKVIKKIDKKTEKPSSTRKLSSRKQENNNKKDSVEEKVVESEELPLTDSLKIRQLSKENYILTNAIYQKSIERPLSAYEYYTSDWNELAQVICRDLIKKDLGIKWSDICGNQKAISVIKEAVLLPIQFPEFFTKNLKPWKAVLLHGPPGTGKTMIAKALCSEVLGNAAFFRVCSSTVISKWRGESEKMIRVLFEVAKFYAPSIVFLDEIEGLTSKRDISSEHEASKRFKNEFLSLLDGLEENSSKIFVLATTNLPWEMDEAFLRRFERKILIELPDVNDRKEMLKKYIFESANLTDETLRHLAEKCNGFTGDEIRIACKEAAMKGIRKICNTKKVSGTAAKISEEDICLAFAQINPIGPRSHKKHWEWSNHYGNII